jgi:hypothetical protein
MRTAVTICLMVVLSFGHLFSLKKAAEGRKTLSEQAESTFVMPAPFLRILALEFDGLVSDILFLKTLVFRGSTYERPAKPRVRDWEWKWMYNMMDASIGIDPYFVDPYYFGAAHFSWDGNLAQETNVLLEKGMQFRTWDFMLPFYIGFNNFYFLHNNKTAADYLMRSWRIPGAPDMFASLASKLSYKDDDTANAIVFLEELLKRTEDKEVSKQYAKRLHYLQGQLALEKALARFRKRHGRMPQAIDELVQRGILSAIPRDPYGGYYYLDQNGTIKSTSGIQLGIPAL